MGRLIASAGVVGIAIALAPFGRRRLILVATAGCRCGPWPPRRNQADSVSPSDYALLYSM
jgi:hypothetical protein